MHQLSRRTSGERKQNGNQLTQVFWKWLLKQCKCLYVLVWQVLIIVKYVFQFSFYPWNQPGSELARRYNLSILNPVYIFGIERTNYYAAFDLFLLFSLFIHRSILKVWKLFFEFVLCMYMKLWSYGGIEVHILICCSYCCCCW